MPRLPSPSDLGGALAPRPSRGVTEHRPAVLDRGTEFLGELGKLAELETDRLEGIAAEHALNKLRGRRVDLTMAEGKGFQHVRGGGVIERPVLKEFPDAFNREIEQISAGLTSRRARDRFRKEADREALGFRTDLMRHVAAQTEAFADATFKATVEVEAGVASSMYNNPDAVTAALQRVEQRVADEAVRLGMTGKDSQDLLLAFSQQTSGAVISAAIQGALGNEDSQTAMALLEQYGGKLSEQQRRGLDTAVKSANAWDRGQKLGEEAFAMVQAGVSATQVEKFINDNTRGSKATYSNAQTVLNQFMGARQEQRKQASESAQDEVNRGANWGAIRHKYLGSMSPEAVAAFDRSARAVSEGKATKTNLGIWDDLTTVLMQDPETFRQLDLNEFSDQLSDSDFRTFRNMQLRPPKDDTELRTFVQQLSDAEMQMSRTKTKGMPIAAKGAFRDRVIERIREEEELKKRPLSERERDAIIREEMTVVEKRTFRPDVRQYEAPRLTPQPGPSPAAPRAPATAVIVPGEDRSLIIQAYLKNQGRHPTEAEIQETYNAFQGAQ